MSSDVPLKPAGFSKVVRVTTEDLAQVNLEKDTVFKMGLDLKNQQGKKSTIEELASCQVGVYCIFVNCLTNIIDFTGKCE